MTKIELRNIDLTSEKDLVVQGLIPTESLSEVLKSGNKHFREKIAKGAFTKALNNKKDIDLLVEHDNKKILASSRNGSLKLEETDSGLFLSAELAKTTLGNDYHELIKSKIIRNVSFGFRVLKDSWEQVGNQMIRTLEDIELSEISVVRNPAYLSTELSARGIDVIENVDVPETKKTMKKDVVKTMEKIVKEKRSTEQTLSTEIRELVTTEAGQAIIPENAANSIVLKLAEVSPIFNMARKFETVNGNLKVPRENSSVSASFVGEGVELSEGALDFDYVEFKQKRVGSVLSLSNQLVNDSSFDLDSYAADLLARKTAQAIEQSLLLGEGDIANEFKGIFNEEGLTEVLTESVKEVTMDDLNALYTSLNPLFLDEAAWIMSRALFNKVAKLKDTTGHYYLQNAQVNGRITHTLFGMPVHVSEAITSEQYPVLFGNFHQATGILIKRGQQLTKITADTKNALRGAQTFVFDMYLDGATINREAVAKLHVKQA